MNSIYKNPWAILFKLATLLAMCWTMSPSEVPSNQNYSKIHIHELQEKHYLAGSKKHLG